MKLHEHAYNMSPHAAQRILGQLMTSPAWPVYSPFAKEHFGRAKSEGEAEAILLGLKARGLDVSETERDRIIPEGGANHARLGDPACWCAVAEF